MHHFFVTPDQIGAESIRMTGTDVNHIKNVLRMKPGEQVLISNGVDRDYHCEVETISAEQVVARILEVREEGTELPAKLYLFQGLPKSDKMELIIQKAVELGVYQIIPFEHAEGMDGTRKELARVKPGMKVGIFIGPEGGFDDSEIDLAQTHDVRPITLGRRILRTETAGLATLSILMFQLES